MTGPFARAAHDLARLGLAVVPVGGPDGKVPLIAWARWRRPPGRAFLDKLAAKHPSAGVGVLCGLSRLTVVDVDDPALVERMVARCGPTPLVTATPSGGWHLWYRSAGERCTDLRHTEDLAVDIKAEGGFVVVPPSPGYCLASGSWADLARLPTVKPGSLPAAQGSKSRTLSLRAVGVGRRNNTLFRLLLRSAPACDAEADLLDIAETIVADHFDMHPDSPFTAAEVAKTVASVWRYQQQGRNWVGKEAFVVTTTAELAILQRNPDALTLRLMLQAAHGARLEPFAVSARSLASCEFIDGWTDFKRYVAARDWLLAQGFLAQTHVGGRGARDPHLFKLSTPVEAQTDNHLGRHGSHSVGGEGCSVILGPSGVPLTEGESVGGLRLPDLPGKGVSGTGAKAGGVGGARAGVRAPGTKKCDPAKNGPSRKRRGLQPGDRLTV